MSFFTKCFISFLVGFAELMLVMLTLLFSDIFYLVITNSDNAPFSESIRPKVSLLVVRLISCNRKALAI